MNQLLLKLAITAAAGSLLSSSPMVAQESPSAPRTAHVEITQGPEIELAKEFLTIIRWTTSNPGGSPVHYGIVHYGTDPKNLSQTAESPIRLNPDHPSTIFRVRVTGLKSGTTYYYTVGAEGSDGTVDKIESAVQQFTLPAEPQQTGP
jgi:Purple acid Phosphatase, N-terminal domain